jgi:hypothetical protein
MKAVGSSLFWEMVSCDAPSWLKEHNWKELLEASFGSCPLQVCSDFHWIMYCFVRFLHRNLSRNEIASFVVKP